MGFKDRIKDLGKKTVDLGMKAGKKGVEIGKKGVDKVKEVSHRKTCSECAHYTATDEHQGNCPLGGQRMATADSKTCPQKAFKPIARDDDEGQHN